MTLIELLAVLCLGSLVVATLGLSGLGRSSRGDLERTVEQLRDADQRARAVATRSGGSELVVRDGELRVLDGDGRLVVGRSLHRGSQLELQPTAILYDSLGRTDSYGAVAKDSERQRDITVNGHTGWIQESDG